jgi:hypothetical protein
VVVGTAPPIPQAPDRSGITRSAEPEARTVCRASCGALPDDSLPRVCDISPSPAWPVEGATVEPTAAFAPLQLGFVDPMPWRNELIRPLVLFADRMAQPRAQETDTHPDTVRTLQRRFHQQGMFGLVPGRLEVTPRGRATRVPNAIRQEIDRLKARYAGVRRCPATSRGRAAATGRSRGTRRAARRAQHPRRGTAACRARCSPRGCPGAAPGSRIRSSRWAG